MRGCRCRCWQSTERELQALWPPLSEEGELRPRVLPSGHPHQEGPSAAAGGNIVLDDGLLQAGPEGEDGAHPGNAELQET